MEQALFGELRQSHDGSAFYLFCLGYVGIYS